MSSLSYTYVLSDQVFPVAFYKEKQQRWGGDPDKWVECIRISPAEELGICEESSHFRGI
jgi:hypothetical protein